MILPHLCVAALLFAALGASAQTASNPPSVAAKATPASPMPADTILADNGVVRITRADYDRELERLPQELRGGFATTERRVADLITRLLVMRTLAEQADRSGLSREPDNVARLEAELVKAKAQLRIAQIEAEAADRFEGQREAWEKRAKDVYAMDPARSTVTEQVTASHIIFSYDKHSPEEAMRLAQEARARIVAGRPFGVVASEVSEDGARAREGRLAPFTRGEMDPAFEKAAFALAPGELSQPVASKFGIHLILVSQHVPARRMSFDEVKPKLMAELRQQFIANGRDAHLAELQDKGRESIDVDRLKLLVIDVPPESELVRMQREQAPRRGDARRK